MKLLIIAIATTYTILRALLAFKFEQTDTQIFAFVMSAIVTGLIIVSSLEVPEYV